MAEDKRADAGAFRRRLLYALLALAAVTTPAWLAGVGPAWVASSYGESTVAFELLGFTVAAVIAAIAATEWRARGHPAFREFLPVVVPLLVGLHTVTLVSEFSRKPFDYDCYEYAARALSVGADPYVTGLNYLYPPLTAQVLAAVHAGVEFAVGALGFAPGDDALWSGVFYLYQCAQLGLILLLYALAESFARKVGIGRPWAPLLVGALLLFDNPLLRTLRHGQVNLWILDLSMLALLLARRRPVLAGAALALAVHVKLYPAVLLLPFAASRCWRAIVWTGLVFAGVVVMQTDLLRDWTTWQQFAAFYSRSYPGELAFRNNSFHSLAFNSLQFCFDVSPRLHRDAIRLAATLVSAAMGVWLLLRMTARARSAQVSGAGEERLLADGADALAFSLLISQSVWEHHYVLALPLVIRVVAERGRARPLAVAVASFLAVGMPTFDLFPLSYHRALGLLALLVLGTPRPSRPSRAARDGTLPPGAAEGDCGHTPSEGFGPR